MKPWTLKFEFHIVFMCHKYFSILQKNVRSTLSWRAAQKTGSGRDLGPGTLRRTEGGTQRGQPECDKLQAQKPRDSDSAREPGGPPKGFEWVSDRVICTLAEAEAARAQESSMPRAHCWLETQPCCGIHSPNPAGPATACSRPVRPPIPVSICTKRWLLPPFSNCE